jgi:hypothetical protein
MAGQTHPRTLVGVFHHASDAFAALRRLDDDGLPPYHVGLVSDDPVLAGETGGHSRALAGSVGGFVLGLAMTALYVLIGGASFRENVPGVVLGALFVAFGLAFIGNVLGRALVVQAPHHGTFEHAVREGGAIVTVECVGDECDHARHLLEGSADEVIEEGAEV